MVLIAVAISILIFFTDAEGVYAETPMYGRAVTERVIIYKSPVEHADYAMFSVPLSYYVTIVGEESTFYVVEYQNNSDGFSKIYGYIKKSELNTDNQNPSAPLYYQTSLSVITSSCFIYTKPDDTAETLATSLKEQNLKFYGKIYSSDKESVFYYVKFGNVLGYVPAISCSAPAQVLNPDPLPATEPEESVQPSPSVNADDTAKKTDVFQIVFIAAITVAALIIVYSMFHTGKNKFTPKDNDRYFDEDDEE